MAKEFQLKPLEDRIVVKPSEEETTTVSGIVIPDTAKEKPQQGEVLAVGPGRWSDDKGAHSPLDVKVGDTVLFTNWAGDEFKQAQGEDVLLMRADDILAVLEG